jgi:hypothetical protein
VPEDKTIPASQDYSSSLSDSHSQGDFYDKLVQKHRLVVEDFSKIEARIRDLESQLDL